MVDIDLLRAIEAEEVVRSEPVRWRFGRDGVRAQGLIVLSSRCDFGLSLLTSAASEHRGDYGGEL
jgi:hypothetical protein